jgi:hypothetical protein
LFAPKTVVFGLIVGDICGDRGGTEGPCVARPPLFNPILRIGQFAVVPSVGELIDWIEDEFTATTDSPLKRPSA